MLLAHHKFGPHKCESRNHRRGILVVARSTGVKSTARQLLDSFWEARGVLDPVIRKRLVDAAEALEAEEVSPLKSAPLSADVPLPGLPATWQLEQSTPEVLAASRRLLALQQMLGGGLGNGDGAMGGSRNSGGGGGIDVVWMVVREPQLLSADLAGLTGRLLEMKLATYGMDVDVLKVIEAQPSLLLSDRWRLDLESFQAADARTPASDAADASAAPASTTVSGKRERVPGGAAGQASAAPAAPAAAPETPAGSGSGAPPGLESGGRSAAADAASSSGRGGAESVQQLVQAWQYGVASDGDSEWSARLTQLAAYVARHGDTCVGFRDGDDPELSRWATKQRADRRRGELAPGRLEQLTALGFHFDADEAEWCRWFSELLEFKRQTGHASPMPLVTGGDMYLINWCSVQRIARRSRVLSESRIQRLDEAGFDWTGADPLS